MNKKTDATFVADPEPIDMNYSVHDALTQINVASKRGPLGTEFLLNAAQWLIDVHNKELGEAEQQLAEYEETP